MKTLADLAPIAVMLSAIITATMTIRAAIRTSHSTFAAARRKDQRETYLAFINAARTLERSVPLVGGKPAPDDVQKDSSKAMAQFENAYLGVYLEGPPKLSGLAQEIHRSAAEGYSAHVVPYLTRRTDDFDVTEDFVDIWRMHLLNHTLQFTNLASRFLNSPRPTGDQPMEEHLLFSVRHDFLS
ncbi:hypothetical protein [Streptomyces capillispiralis]|uniref:hypothetical protein n=1 Tax=Streptomyces capillispiralis TaxID=68182 RepID=UPI0036A696E4